MQIEDASRVIFRFIGVGLIAVSLGLVVSCDSESKTGESEAPGQHHEGQHHEGEHHEGEHHEGEHHEKTGESPDESASSDDQQDSSTVSVSPKGTKFDPPVEISRIPEGVWYCEMQKSHYASQKKGDGKCPICGMKLKKK